MAEGIITSVQRAAAKRLSGDDRDTERLRLAVEAAGLSTFDWDPIGGTLDGSPGLRAIFGLAPGAPLDIGLFRDLLHPEDRDAALAAIEAALDPKGSGRYRSVYRIVGRNGGVRRVEARGRGYFADVGGARRGVRLVAVVAEMAEQPAEAANARLAAIVSASPDAFVSFAAEDGRILSWNKGAEELFGYSEAEALGAPVSLLVPEEGLPAPEGPRGAFDWVMAKGRVQTESVRRRKDGSLVDVSIRAAVMRDADGRVLGVSTIFSDISARKAAEAALEESRRRLNAVLDNATVAIFLMDENQHCVYMNAAAEVLTGYSLAETIGRPLHDVIHHTRPDGTHYPLAECPIDRAFPEHKQQQGEETFVHKDGSFYPVAFTASPIRDENAATIGTIIEVRDVRAEKEAEAALRESEERFRVLAETLPQLVWTARPDGSNDWYNQRWYDFTGTSPAGMRGEEWHARLHPEDCARASAAWRHSLATAAPYETECRLRQADGSYHWFLARALPLCDDEARVLRWFGTCTDLDDVVSAREAIARSQAELEGLVAERTAELVAASDRLRSEMKERERAEEALRHAQKMEAVGQLTGGVAHDFNNLLTVVIGNLELLNRRLGENAAEPERLRRTADQALSGARRAATLTQRLLAFSRRQPLDPKPVDLNRLVGGMSDLLHRTLGEHIAVETVQAGGLWATLADPSQLENAILNLAVNARDAMPDGGKLTIETGNVHLDEGYVAHQAEVVPGQYVAISVTDTGRGMDKEVIERAFEPFFTTKDVGHGTGLGLSQVYGFVKQTGGHVKLYSEPGQGTTVRLYLPRFLTAQAEEEERADEVAPLSRPSGHRAETVLVVEDEPEVRAYSCEVLRDLGYEVLQAPDGPAGLRVLEEQGARVDLLFTDVGLPGGLNGRQFADKARAMLPGLKILFTSGYARNAIVHQGRLDPGVRVLTKPFTPAALAAKLREAMDAPTVGATRRVLVIEDEALVRMLAVDLLNELGLEAEEAGTASEALSRLRAGPERFDAVLVDVGLPDLRGDALAREIRAFAPALPLVLASGYDIADLKALVKDDDRLGFLGKPYDIDRMRSVLSSFGIPVNEE
jgi:PAS domain S-box-containing protein